MCVMGLLLRPLVGIVSFAKWAAQELTAVNTSWWAQALCTTCVALIVLL
jgi:hypothetical protein